MANIILPIKSEFVKKILSGDKKYEYRKKLCSKFINKIYIYETYPIKMIVGEVFVKDKIICEKEMLWQKTKEFSGITKSFFDSYFINQEVASAYYLGDIKKYKNEKSLAEFGLYFYPQSFVYVDI